MTRTSNVNLLIQTLAGALADLGKIVPLPEVERLATRIHRSMDSPKRAYHTSQHVLELCVPDAPLATLAALYHDIAYYQLDGGFPDGAGAPLATLIERPDGPAGDFVLRLSPATPLAYQLCAAVFGYEDGHKLAPLGGLNEFASAIIAASELAPWLNTIELLGVIACIEATVPFRGPDAAGLNMPEALLARLQAAVARFALPCGEALLADYVGAATAMANRDVAGFAEPDGRAFLANTWLLIEESNAALVAVGVYTIQDYRRALGRMEGFLSFLAPEKIFHSFAGAPDAAGLAGLVAAARRNIDLARRYLADKLSTMAVIEALALATGGDCPVSMMLGDLPNPRRRLLRVDDLLPPVAEKGDCDPALLEVFDQGRREASQRDLTHSPLTAYIYRAHGEAGMRALFEKSKALFAGTLAPLDFLLAVDPAVRKAIVEACACIAVSRAQALRALPL